MGGVATFIITYYHVDGQKIAKRLAGQILKEVNAIKELLHKYNSSVEDSSKAMPYTSALDPAIIGSLLSTVTSSCYDLGSRKETIDAYVMLLRSKEEKDMLQIEVQNTVSFYQQKKQVIETTLRSSSPGPGARCLLHQLLGKVEVLLMEVQHTQQLMKNLMPVLMEEDSNSDSDVSEYSDYSYS